MECNQEDKQQVMNSPVIHSAPYSVCNSASPLGLQQSTRVTKSSETIRMQNKKLNKTMLDEINRRLCWSPTGDPNPALMRTVRNAEVAASSSSGYCSPSIKSTELRSNEFYEDEESEHEDYTMAVQGQHLYLSGNLRCCPSHHVKIAIPDSTTSLSSSADDSSSLLVTNSIRTQGDLSTLYGETLITPMTVTLNKEQPVLLPRKPSTLRTSYLFREYENVITNNGNSSLSENIDTNSNYLPVRVSCSTNHEDKGIQCDSSQSSTMAECSTRVKKKPSFKIFGLGKQQPPQQPASGNKSNFSNFTKNLYRGLRATFRKTRKTEPSIVVPVKELIPRPSRASYSRAVEKANKKQLEAIEKKRKNLDQVDSRGGALSTLLDENTYSSLKPMAQPNTPMLGRKNFISNTDFYLANQRADAESTDFCCSSGIFTMNQTPSDCDPNMTGYSTGSDWLADYSTESNYNRSLLYDDKFDLRDIRYMDLSEAAKLVR